MQTPRSSRCGGEGEGEGHGTGAKEGQSKGGPSAGEGRGEGVDSLPSIGLNAREESVAAQPAHLGCFPALCLCAFSLSLFPSHPPHLQVIFTKSATGALKLLGETFPWSQGSTFRCV